MEAILQRVFKVTTMCMDARSQSFLPLVNGLIHDALLQSSPRLKKLQYVGEVGKLTTF